MSNDEFNSSQRQNEFVVLLTLGLKPWVNIFPIAEFPMVATLRLTCGNVGGNYLYRYFSIRQRGSLTVQNHLYGFTLWYFSRACFLLFAFGFQQKSVAILFGTPKRRIRHCTLASHLICPNCYNIMNPHGLSVWLACISNLSTKKYGAYCLPIPTFRRHLKTHYFQSAWFFIDVGVL